MSLTKDKKEIILKKYLSKLLGVLVVISVVVLATIGCTSGSETTETDFWHYTSGEYELTYDFHEDENALVVYMIELYVSPDVLVIFDEESITIRMSVYIDVAKDSVFKMLVGEEYQEGIKNEELSSADETFFDVVLIKAELDESFYTNKLTLSFTATGMPVEPTFSIVLNVDEEIGGDAESSVE